MSGDIHFAMTALSDDSDNYENMEKKQIFQFQHAKKIFSAQKNLSSLPGIILSSPYSIKFGINITYGNPGLLNVISDCQKHFHFKFHLN